MSHSWGDWEQGRNRHQSEDQSLGQWVGSLDLTPQRSLNFKTPWRDLTGDTVRFESNILNYINRSQLITYFKPFETYLLFFLAVESSWYQSSPVHYLAFCRVSSNLRAFDSLSRHIWLSFLDLEFQTQHSTPSLTIDSGCCLTFSPQTEITWMQAFEITFWP